MEEFTLTVTPREADLLRKLLVSLRSVLRIREQCGDRTKPLDFETWGEVWQWAFRNGVELNELEPLIQRLRV